MAEGNTSHPSSAVSSPTALESTSDGNNKLSSSQQPNDPSSQRTPQLTLSESPNLSSVSGPTSPVSPVSATSTSPTSERPSAAHAAISSTVAITPALANQRLSQGQSLSHGTEAASLAASRPTTSGSRSHVSSLRSPAFLNPMSSQRLQAHRSHWPGSPPMGSTRETSFEQQGRFSHESSSTARDTPRGLHTGYYEHEDEATVPPTSRGSEDTERENKHEWNHTGTATNAGLINGNMRHEAAQSMDTFHNTNEAQKSASLDPEKGFMNGHEPGSRSRSPRGIIANFRRRSEQESSKTKSHEKLSSRGSSSPRKPSIGAKARGVLGKNWEYFDGNTLFFAGGRLQTAKDKPIAMATALAVIFPAIMFFIFW